MKGALIILILATPTWAGVQNLLPQARSHSCLAWMAALNEQATQKTKGEAVQAMRNHYFSEVGSGRNDLAGTPRVDTTSPNPFRYSMGPLRKRLLGIHKDAGPNGSGRTDPEFQLKAMTIKGKEKVADVLARAESTMNELAFYSDTTTRNLWTVLSTFNTIMLAVPPYSGPSTIVLIPGNILPAEFIYKTGKNTDWNAGRRMNRLMGLLDESKPGWIYWADSVRALRSLVSSPSIIAESQREYELAASLPFGLTLGNPTAMNGQTTLDYNPNIPPFLEPKKENNVTLSVDLLLKNTPEPTLTIVTRTSPRPPRYPVPAKQTESLLDKVRRLIPAPTSPIKD